MTQHTSLTWVHISDLHFGHGDAHWRFDQVGVTQALLLDAEAMCKRLGPPDLVVVTGDIAFSGQPSQYQQAKRWLLELRQALGGSARILLVPGNHDIDRKQGLKDSGDLIHAGLRSDTRKLDDLLEVPDKMKAIWPKLQAYSEFSKDFEGCAIESNQPFWVQELPASGFPKRIIACGLNTALLCFDDKDARTNLRLGRGQLVRAIQKQPADSLFLVLQHHPPEWLFDGEQLKNQLAQRAHILFSGHVHQQQGIMHASLGGGVLLQLVAGAGHADSNEEGYHGYAWGRLDSLGFTYYSRVWVPTREAFAPAVMLDSDDFKRHDHAFIERLRLPKKLADCLPEPSRDSAPVDNQFGVPAAAHRFFGREQELLSLHELLQQKRAVSISGLDGTGKSALAREYVRQFQEKYLFIAWLSASDAASLKQNLVNISGYLSARLSTTARLPEQAQDRLKFVLQTLRKTSGWLIVFDNIVEPADISQLWPDWDNGYLLCTTQKKFIKNGHIHSMELLGLSDNDAIHLLSERSLNKFTGNELSSAKTLVRTLGNLPLAIDQAGGYMAQNEVSPSGYLDRLLCQRTTVLAADELIDDSQTIMSVWKMSLNRIESTNQASMDLLKISSFLSPILIPEFFIRRGSQYMGESIASTLKLPEDAVALDNIMRPLLDYSLIKRIHNLPVAGFQIHQLVQLVIRHELLMSNAAPIWINGAVRALNAAFPHMVTYSDWTDCNGLIDSIRSILAFENVIDDYSETALELASLLYRTSKYLLDQGVYAEAKKMGNKSRSIRERLLGVNNLSVAETLVMLGNILIAEGQYREAEELCRRGFEIQELLLGFEHVEIIATLNAWARALRGKEEIVTALEVCQRGLNLCGQLIGHESVERADLLNTLGNLLSDQKRLDDAEGKYKESLHIRQMVLGSEHPDTARSLHNIALVLSMKGKYHEAEAIYRDSLSMKLHSLGKSHPDTVLSIKNLAEISKRQGSPEEVKKWFEETEMIYKEIVNIAVIENGEDHIDSWIATRSLGNFYYNNEKYNEAEIQYEMCLKVQNRRLKVGEFERAITYSWLADALSAQKKTTAAISKYYDCLRIREAILGKNHPNTAWVYNSLGNVFEGEGKTDDAEKAYKEFLQRLELSENGSVDTAWALNNLGIFYENHARFEEAEKLYRKCFELREKILGQQHPDTAWALHNLADALAGQTKDKWEEAAECYLLCLRIQKSISSESLGAAQTYYDLASLCLKQRQLFKAISYYKDCLDIRAKDSKVENSGIADVLSAIGSAYYDTKFLWFISESYYRQALRIRKKVLGDTHKDTALSRQYLADVLYLQYRLFEAETLYHQCLLVRADILGKDDPDTIFVRRRLTELSVRRRYLRIYLVACGLFLLSLGGFSSC